MWPTITYQPEPVVRADDEPTDPIGIDVKLRAAAEKALRFLKSSGYAAEVRRELEEALKK